MCGRFTLRAAGHDVAEQFEVSEPGDWKPRYNIAPSQPVAVVHVVAKDSSIRELAQLRWGLIPSWAKDPAIGNRLINARAETVADKPAFRVAFRRRRCLIIADGFYEWRKVGKGKIPYFFRLREDRPFAFAGLRESWQDSNNHSIESCTIITTSPNKTVQPIHNRMPVILDPKDYDLWIDPAVTQPELLLSVLCPCPSDELEAFPVSSIVNKPANDNPRCVEPHPYE